MEQITSSYNLFVDSSTGHNAQTKGDDYIVNLQDADVHAGEGEHIRMSLSNFSMAKNFTDVNETNNEFRFKTVNSNGVHMTFQTFKSNQNVVIRLAKNGLNNDVADSNNENPGPLANMYMNSYQNAGKIHSIGCAQITHIMTLAVHDEVSVHTVQVGYNDPNGNNVHTREGYSQFLAEYLG